MATARIVKNETVAFLGELIGTFLFLFFGFAGAQTVNHAVSQSPLPADKNIPNLGNLMFISTIFGVSLMVNVWVFFRISGGMFNPVVTMSLYLVGAFPILRAAVVMGAQISGAIIAAAVVKYLIPNGREVKHTLSLSTNTSITRGLLLEMFFTAELIFTILMLAAEKSKTTFVAPIGIGFALFVAHMGGVFYTGAGLNPARAFASAVVASKFPPYHWIYWVGPAMGGLLAVLIFKVFKILRYEDTNGDQDKSDYEPGTSFLEKSAKRVSRLLDKTAHVAEKLKRQRRDSAVFPGDGPYELRRQTRDSSVFTGDIPYDLRQRRSGSPRVSPRTTRNHSMRYPPEYHAPATSTSNYRPQPQQLRRALSPDHISVHTLKDRPYIYSPELTKKSSLVRHSEILAIDSASSSILNFGGESPPPMPRPPVAPFPSRRFEIQMQNSIPIGMARGGMGVGVV